MKKTPTQRKSEIEAVRAEVREAGKGQDKAARVKTLLAKSSAGLHHKDTPSTTLDLKTGKST